MNVTKAKLAFHQAASSFPESCTTETLEKAAIAFAKAKQRNADNRDKWKVRKRLAVSRVTANAE